MQVMLTYPKIAVIRPQGFLSATNALEFERDLTSTLTKNEDTTVLIDFEQVEALDSAGLMALVSALKLAQNLGRRFSLCSLCPSLKIVFELTQLDKVFEIFESQAAFAATYASLEGAALAYR